MKKLLAILVLTARAAFASTLPDGNVNGHIGLSWPYPTNELDPSVRFFIYATTNITLSTSQWTPVTNIMATNFVPYQTELRGSNWYATNLTARLDIQPAHYFFVATASNMWGESAIYQTNVASTPFPPVVINNSLKIEKLP